MMNEDEGGINDGGGNEDGGETKEEENEDEGEIEDEENEDGGGDEDGDEVKHEGEVQDETIHGDGAVKNEEYRKKEGTTSTVVTGHTNVTTVSIGQILEGMNEYSYFSMGTMVQRSAVRYFLEEREIQVAGPALQKAVGVSTVIMKNQAWMG